jgi:hypothetical protein
LAPHQGNTSFGPNTEIQIPIDLRGSHRDENFRILYRETTTIFQQSFNLEDFDILFLPGGGTLGVEATMASARQPITVIGCDGVFKDRWSQMSSRYNDGRTGESLALSCHIETSVSVFQEYGTPILDVVSSFPYYQIPDSCDVFISASNKQLRSLAGLAIVGVRKGKFEKYFRESEMSYLSLGRYLNSALQGEIPSTVGTYLFDVLRGSIMRFNLDTHRKEIDSICEMFVNRLGESVFLGDFKGPVLTIRREAIPERVARKWNLYEKARPDASYQIFTYSTKKKNYELFLSDFDTAIKR